MLTAAVVVTARKQEKEKQTLRDAHTFTHTDSIVNFDVGSQENPYVIVGWVEEGNDGFK